MRVHMTLADIKTNLEMRMAAALVERDDAADAGRVEQADRAMRRYAALGAAIDELCRAEREGAR